MFSKLMKKTIAAVAMLAMASAFAGVTTPWWSIDFAGDAYTNGGVLPASEGWTQVADDESSVQDSALNLNTQGNDLVYTPSENTEKFDSVILDADVTFVASDVEPTTDDDMQTAIYLKAKEDGTNVLCAWGKQDNNKVWLELFELEENTYDVNIVINYAEAEPVVTVKVGEKFAEYRAAEAKTEVSSVAFRGTGKVDNFVGQKYLEKTYVANVGEQQFEKYAEALAYVAANGGTLTITGDSDEELSFGTFTFNGVNATIDLGGKEITAAFVVDGGAELTINNGTVNAPMGYDVIYIKNGKAIVGATANLYASDNCVVFMKNTENADADLILDVYGKLYVENDTGYAAIQGNGINVAASEITIQNGAVVSHKYDTAIYHPQNGTLTIGAATITGTTGIEMRAGKLVVDGATIVATGTPASTDENNDGTTTVGAAIALSQHSTKLPTSVEVNAGVLTGEYAFLQYNGNETASENISATIAAGVELNGAVVVTETGFAMPKADDGSYTLASGVAIVGNNVYETLADAVAAAAAGDTVTLIADATASEIVTINKAITLDGNGKTLTSTAARAINIDTTGAVVINDLTIVAKGERAVNIINQASTVTLNNVTASAKNYAVMIATSAAGAKLTVNDSDLTGLAVVNVAAPNATVVINDTDITNVDANDDENYGAISTFKTATGATVTVNGGKVVVADDSAAAFNATANSSIVFNGTEGEITIMTAAAYIGDAGYETLEEALEDVKDGETITLNADITASEIITINKDITFDGNGYTLTSTAARAINVDGADGATIENLTIVASGERGINLINGATNVTIDNVDVTAKNYAVNLAASAANAVVSIEGSTLSGLNALNVAAAGADITVDNAVINCNDNSESESYAAIILNPGATGAEVVASNTTINIQGDSFPAVNSAVNGKITINGSEDVKNAVAKIDYADGYTNLFWDLASAVAKATASDTITLIAAVAEDVAISGTTTIDLNDYAVEGTFTLTDTAAKLYAAENLTVETSVDGYEVVFANGCYSLQKKAVEVEFAPVKTTSIAIVGNTAKLTIDGEYTEVKVYFKETLDAEFDEITPTSFVDGVITVPAETDTGFFTVHAR